MRYELMQRAELKECAHVIAEGFMDYDYFRFWFPDDSVRARTIEKILNTELRCCTAQGADVLVAKDGQGIAGVAILDKPGFKDASDLVYCLNGWLGVLHTGGAKEGNGWLQMEYKCKVPCREANKTEWYLNCLVIRKSREGRGVGSAFLKDGIKPFVDAKGAKSLVLFTNSESNRRFYEKNGCELFDERTVDANGHELGSWSYRLRW